MTNETKTIVISFSAGLVALVSAIAFGFGLLLITTSIIESQPKPASVTAPTRPWLLQPDSTPFRPSVGSPESKESLLEKKFGPVDMSAAQEPKQCGGIFSRRVATRQSAPTTTHRYTLATPETTYFYSNVYRVQQPKPVVAPVAIRAPQPVNPNHPATDPSSSIDGTVALKESKPVPADCPDGTCKLRGAFTYPDIFSKVK